MLASARTFARGHTAVLRALLRLRCHDDVVHVTGDDVLGHAHGALCHDLSGLMS